MLARDFPDSRCERDTRELINSCSLPHSSTGVVKLAAREVVIVASPPIFHLFGDKLHLPRPFVHTLKASDSASIGFKSGAFCDWLSSFVGLSYPWHYLTTTPVNLETFPNKLTMSVLG